MCAVLIRKNRDLPDERPFAWSDGRRAPFQPVSSQILSSEVLSTRATEEGARSRRLQTVGDFMPRRKARSLAQSRKGAAQLRRLLFVALFSLVPGEGFEPQTFGLQNQGSVHGGLFS